MKKSSQLGKIAVVLSIFESSLFLFSVTNAKAIDKISMESSTIYEKSNFKDYSMFSEKCFSYEASVECDKELKNREEDIVKCAYTLIGKPYVYGATGPNEFDCSGLTQYVYRSTGKDISRTTYTQVKEGIEVNKKDLMPGDLVFFNTNGYMSHVGIYVGNGAFIHAPRTGKPVMVSSLKDGYYCERFATARRIIN